MALIPSYGCALTEYYKIVLNQPVNFDHTTGPTTLPDWFPSVWGMVGVRGNPRLTKELLIFIQSTAAYGLKDWNAELVSLSGGQNFVVSSKLITMELSGNGSTTKGLSSLVSQYMVPESEVLEEQWYPCVQKATPW